MNAKEIEANLKAITDRLDHLDPLVTGKEFLFFRCSHSGKFFPGDYVKEWGRRYGVGIGGEVRSEALDTMYEVDPMLHKSLRSIKQIMHPCKVSGAPVIPVFLAKIPARKDLLIPEFEDKYGDARAEILLSYQMKNKRSKIRLYQTMYAKQFGLVMEDTDFSHDPGRPK